MHSLDTSSIRLCTCISIFAIACGPVSSANVSNSTDNVINHLRQNSHTPRVPLDEEPSRTFLSTESTSEPPTRLELPIPTNTSVSPLPIAVRGRGLLSLNWNSWDAWQPCNVSCGGGVRSRGRVCNPATPPLCVGVANASETCGESPCPEKQVGGKKKKNYSVNIILITGITLPASLVVLSGCLWFFVIRKNNEINERYERRHSRVIEVNNELHGDKFKVSETKSNLIESPLVPSTTRAAGTPGSLKGCDTPCTKANQQDMHTINEETLSKVTRFLSLAKSPKHQKRVLFASDTKLDFLQAQTPSWTSLKHKKHRTDSKTSRVSLAQTSTDSNANTKETPKQTSGLFGTRLFWP